MSKISPSVDELMWLIAEEGDPATINSFIVRYPDHRKELYRRLHMLRDFKSAGSVTVSKRPPEFRLRNVSTRREIPRWAWLSAAAVGLFGVGFASYTAVSRFNAPAEVPLVQSSTQPMVSEPRQSGPLRSPKNLPEQQQAPPVTTSSPPAVPAEREVTLQLDHTSLFDALNALAAASGVKFQIAPNTPNMELRLSYVKKPLNLVLQDLGSVAGFTAMRQDDKSYLIVPAVDPNAPGPPAAVEGGAVPAESDLPSSNPSPKPAGKPVLPMPQ